VGAPFERFEETLAFEMEKASCVESLRFGILAD
jgi:hypothetical protein